MTRIVHCIKLGVEAEGLDFAPWPGELGQRIFAQVSKQAWQEWQQLEYRINTPFQYVNRACQPINQGWRRDERPFTSQKSCSIHPSPSKSPSSPAPCGGSSQAGGQPVSCRAPVVDSIQCRTGVGGVQPNQNDRRCPALG